MQKNLKKLVDSSDERVAMAFTDLAFIAEAIDPDLPGVRSRLGRVVKCAQTPCRPCHPCAYLADSPLPANWLGDYKGWQASVAFI